MSLTFKDSRTLLDMDLEPGMWVSVTKRTKLTHFGYEHEGIVASSLNGTITIVHFTQPPGTTAREDMCILETPLEDFTAGGEQPRIKTEETSPFPPDEIVRRARSFIGRKKYRFFLGNCTHFASDCFRGAAFNEQMHSAGMFAMGGACVMALVAAFLLGASRNPWR